MTQKLTDAKETLFIVGDMVETIGHPTEDDGLVGKIIYIGKRVGGAMYTVMMDDGSSFGARASELRPYVQSDSPDVEGIEVGHSLKLSPENLEALIALPLGTRRYEFIEGEQRKDGKFPLYMKTITWVSNGNFSYWSRRSPRKLLQAFDSAEDRRTAEKEIRYLFTRRIENLKAGKTK